MTSPGGRRVVCSMGVSLDGFFLDADGRFDWARPDPEVFRAALDELRGVDTHFLGRRLYETMLFWDAPPHDHPLDDDERTWAAMWQQLPKVVFSRTLDRVQGAHTRLADGDLAQEVERWRAGPGEGDLALGGPELSAQAAARGLVDEYRVRVHPVLLGGGTPFFPPQRADLELVSSREVGSSGVVLSRYRVLRGAQA